MSDIISSALQQRNGVVCVFTEDGIRHYVRGYKYDKEHNPPKLSECDEVLRSDYARGLTIYEDIDGRDCLHKDYFRAFRHAALGGPY